MKKFILALLLPICWLGPVRADVLDYKISTYQGFASTNNDLKIYRDQDAVLYVYQQGALAVLWQLDARGRLIKSVYSDRDQFGIDYQYEDLKSSQGEQNLAAKMLMFDPAQDMTLKNPVANKTAEHLLHKTLAHYVDKSGETQLYWQGEHKLVYFLQTGNRQMRQVWQMQSYDADPNIAAQEIRKRQNYASIDFADIGDNESLQPLQRMLRRGVVAHASGFYRANGTPILRPHVH